MRTRTDLLNHLAEKYNLQMYLEIGVQNPDQNFNKIKCGALKTSVDPDPNASALHCVTSDEFFSYNKDQFDLIFIDGLHTAEQVKKDFENALKILSPGGFIVLHDCNPLKEEHTIVPRPTPTGHWNGDVYKFAMNLKCQKYCVDIDNGCMVVPHQERINLSEYLIPFTNNEIWRHFSAHRKELLNLISWDEFIRLNPHL